MLLENSGICNAWHNHCTHNFIMNAVNKHTTCNTVTPVEAHKLKSQKSNMRLRQSRRLIWYC